MAANEIFGQGETMSPCVELASNPISVDSTILNRVAGVVNHETSYRDSSRPREEKEAEENKRREREFLTCADGCLAPWLLFNDIPRGDGKGV